MSVWEGPTELLLAGLVFTGLAYRWNFTDNRYADIDMS